MVLLSLWWATGAAAHEALEKPIPRYPSDGLAANKACPCGVGPNDTRCTGEARSDPNRAEDRVTTYTAGDTITVRLHEVIGHSGRWRIAFDPDGADQEDFDANILLDEPDPPGNAGNTGEGDLWKFEITLPDEPCDNCTLQVLQIMNGNTEDPVPDPVGHSTYYQCADLVLVAGPPGGEDTDAVTTGLAGQDTGLGEPARGCGCATGAPPALGGVLALVGFAARRRRTRALAASPQEPLPAGVPRSQ